MAAESIKVCCRFRMEFDHDEAEYDEWNFNQETACISLFDKKFTYDYILPPITTQEVMYDQVAKKTITDFIEGFHGTIFAYGQSGSGKTYSMLGPDSVFNSLTNENDMNELYGITPRAVYQIYEQLKEYSRDGASWKLCLSYIEIYNEKLKCLLSNKEGLKIREDPVEGFIIPEKAVVDCKVPETVFKNIYLATNNRATGSTKQNERSSRSHAILQLELIFNSLEGVVRKSRLSLVDLAGSERIAKTSAEGQRLKEAQKINQSLTTLGMVIMALTTPGSKHVPFRNSKLTLILKDSLGGSSKTTLLCTASRLKKHKEESIQTLYFASRAKTIKNITKQNVILNAGELQYIANGLKQQLRILRGQIKRIGSRWNDIVDGKLLSFITNDEYEEDTSEEPLIKASLTAKAPTKFLTSIPEEDSAKKPTVNSEELQALKANMETERLLLQKIIDELNDKVDKKEKEKDEITRKFTTYIDQINHLEVILQEKKLLEEKINQLSLDNSAQKSQLANLQTQIQIFEIENENLNATVEESEITNIATYGKYQATQKEMTDKLQEKTKVVYELEQKASDANAKVEAIESIYDAKEKSLNAQLESARLEIVKLNKMLNTTLTDAQVLTEKEHMHAQTISSFKATNEEILKENEKLKKDILKMKLAFNSEKVGLRTQYEKQINELNSTVNEKNATIEKLKDADEALNNKMNAKDKQIDLLKQSLSDKDKEIDDLKERLKVKVGVYIEENEQLKKELGEKEEALALKEKKSDELAMTIKKLTSELQNAKSDALNNTFTKTPTKLFRGDAVLESPIPIKKTKTLGGSPGQNVFGVTLKKTTGGGTDFLKLAKKESSLITKQTEMLFKDKIDMLTNLRSNMVYDSPHTVSSRSDIDDELSLLDFANEETFLKAEEKLLAKEIEYQVKKELRESVKK